MPAALAGTQPTWRLPKAGGREGAEGQVPVRSSSRFQRNAPLRPEMVGEGWWQRESRSQCPAPHPDLQKPGRPVPGPESVLEISAALMGWGNKDESHAHKLCFSDLGRRTHSRFFFTESQGLPRAKVSWTTGLGDGQQVLSSR